MKNNKLEDKHTNKKTQKSLTWKSSINESSLIGHSFRHGGIKQIMSWVDPTHVLYGRSYQINQMSTAKQTRKFSSTYHKCVDISPSDSLNGWFCHAISPQEIIKKAIAIDAMHKYNMNDTIWDSPWDILRIC